MIYADTNVLLSLLCEDDLSDAADAWYRDADQPVATSLWSVIEFRSNIGLRVRKKLLPRVKGQAAMSELDRLLRASLHTLVPIEDHFTRARDWLANHRCALRSGDALHLAIAFGHGCVEFVSFDRPLGAAAKKLGLPVRILRA